MLCRLDHSRSHCLPAPEPWVSGSAATRGSPAARDKAEAVGAGQRRECFVSAKQPPPARGGWGRCQDPQRQPPPWEAPSQLQSEYTETMETGGKRGGGAQPDKGSNPTPGLSSFLQVLFFDPLKPSKEAQHSLTLREREVGFRKEPATLPPESVDQPSNQKPQQISHPQAVSLTTCKSLETP